MLNLTSDSNSLKCFASSRMNCVNEDDEKQLRRMEDKMLFKIWDRSGLEREENSQVDKSGEEMSEFQRWIDE